MYTYLQKVSTFLKVEYILAINLYFDTPDYLEKLISFKPKGLKVHGISMGLYDFALINQ